MTHPIPAVQRLDEHVRLLLRVLDVEYEGDTPNHLPEKLIEMYRTALVAARGIPAIDATAAWAHAHLGYELPESLYGQLDQAKGSLRSRKTTAAQEALHRANGIVVTEVPSGLSLPGMARVAALSSTLVTIAELVDIGMSCDFGREPADVWPLIDEPTEGRLIEILADAIDHDLRRQGTDGSTPMMVRQTIARANPIDHAGLLILLGAAGDGTLQRLCRKVEVILSEKRRRSAQFSAEFAAS